MLCLSWDKNEISMGGWQSLLNLLDTTNKTLRHVKVPRVDIDKAIKSSKNKEQFKDRAKELMDKIYQHLKINSNNQVYVPFLLQKERTYDPVALPDTYNFN